MPYALPMLQYEIAVSRRIASCPAELMLTPKETTGPGGVKVPGKPTPTGVWLPTLAVATSADGTPSVIAGERYLIDYAQLKGWSQTTSFTIGYHPDSEILKTINASADDHSDDMLKAAAAIGLSVAGLVTGPPGTAAAAAIITAANAKAATPPAPMFEFMKGFPAIAPMFVGAEFVQLAPKTPQDQLKALLLASKADLKVVACTSPVAAETVERAAKAEALDALRTGALVDTMKRFPAPVDPAKPASETVANPLRDKATLAELNDRIKALLPLAGARALGASQRAEFLALLRWQGDILGQIDALTSEIASIDAKLSDSASDRWPKNFHDSYRGDIATTDLKKLPGMLVVETKPILDRSRFADNLAKWAAQPGMQAKIEENFPGLLAAFIDPLTQMPRTFDPPLAGCVATVGQPTVTVTGCLGNEKIVAMFVKRDNEDLLNCAPGETLATECLTNPLGNNNLIQPVAGHSQLSDAQKKTLVTAHNGRDGNFHDGVFVRPPIRAQLAICKSSVVPTTGNPNSERKDPYDAATAKACLAKSVIKSDFAWVPQLGQLRHLPLVNKEFQNNALVLSLSPLGRIESFSFTTSKAAGAAALGAAKDVAKQLGDAKKSAVADLAKSYQDKITLLENAEKYQEKISPAAPTEAEKAQAARNKTIDEYKARRLALVAQACFQAAEAGQPQPEYCSLALD
jgi:hypothetical protein